MRVAFLYNEFTEDPSFQADEPDAANSPIVVALRELGHQVTAIAATLDLAIVREELRRARPEVAFNRVDSLGGSDRMMAVLPLLLDTMRIPYTGCRADALLALSSKVSVKERLKRAGLPTPAWITADANRSERDSFRRSKYILKSVFEHASFGLDDGAVIDGADVDEVVARVLQREEETTRPHFAEEFIEGREFNLSVWDGNPPVLPPAEIDFAAFPPGKPRIVGQRAKHELGSFEYRQTPRTFDFPEADGPLIRRLSDLALQCWETFDLRGYARVDFRCDAAGEPWILEINGNPCLNPSSGFAAALARAGIGYDEALERILQSAFGTPRRAFPSDASNRCAISNGRG